MAARRVSPAQALCYAIGALLVLAGLVGFLYTGDFGRTEVTDELRGDKLLGILAVNGFHNALHLGSGLALLVAAPRARAAAVTALGFGAAYAIIALLGFVGDRELLGAIPVNQADNYLHAALAAAGLLAGTLSLAAVSRRPVGVAETGIF